MAKPHHTAARLDADTYDRLKARLKMRLADLLGRSTHDGRPAPRGALEEPLRRMVGPLSQELLNRSLAPEDEERLLRDVIDEVVG